MSPTNIRALRDDGVLEITWSDGRVDRLPFRRVRGRCKCAACVDENTGRRVVDVDDVPADVAPVSLAPTGNYAIKITWSDGHATGLYTWEHLANLGREE